MLTLTADTSRNGCVTVPLVWSMLSQEPPESVEAAAVQLIEPTPMLRMPKLSGRGAPACATAMKVRPVCESRIFCCDALIDMVTGIVTLSPASALETVTDPLYVPAARLPGAAVTLRYADALPATAPVAGETLSHPPPVVVAAAAVNAMVPAPRLDTLNCWLDWP